MLPTAGATTTAPVSAPAAVASSNTAAVGSWRWPTDGKVIDSFSASEGGNKGIDIAGSRGQPITATASGRVVYAGNALRGYGNLIIIKHNDDYLSAYAHNDTMLVREQQDVTAGQKSLRWAVRAPAQFACTLKFVTREIRKPAAFSAAAINRAEYFGILPRDHG